MKLPIKSLHDEEGFVLITGLLILLILTMLGITATRNTSIELQIAGNDRLHKETFYSAESGAILGTEIIEHSFNCPTGFQRDTQIDGVWTAEVEGVIRVYDRGNDLILWRNALPAYVCGTAPNNADAAFPVANIPSGVEVDYLQFGGETSMLPGGSLQMAAGYEGKGKSAAQGGVAKIMDIYSQFRGPRNSQSVLLFGWRHLIGSEGACIY